MRCASRKERRGVGLHVDMVEAVDPLSFSHPPVRSAQVHRSRTSPQRASSTKRAVPLSMDPTTAAVQPSADPSLYKAPIETPAPTVDSAMEVDESQQGVAAGAKAAASTASHLPASPALHSTAPDAVEHRGRESVSSPDDMEVVNGNLAGLASAAAATPSPHTTASSVARTPQQHPHFTASTSPNQHTPVAITSPTEMEPVTPLATTRQRRAGAGRRTSFDPADAEEPTQRRSRPRRQSAKKEIVEVGAFPSHLLRCCSAALMLDLAPLRLPLPHVCVIHRATLSPHCRHTLLLSNSFGTLSLALLSPLV